MAAAALAPILAAFAGLQPPWPPGIAKATALLLVLALAAAWPVVSAPDKTRRQRVIWIAAGVCVASLLVYLGLLSIFTYKVPTSAQVTIVLGCGYTDGARDVAIMDKLDTSFGCPGDYERLLQTAQYEAGDIWTHTSIMAVQVALLATWLSMLTALAIALFTFTAGQKPPVTKAIKSRT